jgi:glycosyltransferase involved in cell wall biosynthesis
VAEKIPILYVNASFGGGGGADTVVLNTAKLLDRDRFDVVIAYLRKRDRTLEPILERLRALGIEHCELPGRVFDVGQLSRLKAIMDERKIKIYHSHEFKSNFYGALMKLMRRDAVYVSTAHGWNPTSLKVAAYMRLDKFALRYFDKVIAVSTDIENIAKSYGIKRTMVMLNAVDVDRWKLRSGVESKKSGKPFAVGYVGRLSREKGPLDFLRVGAELAKRVRAPIELVVAGSGPEEGAAKAEAKKLGIGEAVKFLGHVSSDDLLKVYPALDALLLPSYTEGVPMTVLEAASVGVPIVATRVGGVGEVITHEENGLLCEAGDIRAMATSLARLYDDRALAQKFSIEGRKNAEQRFSLQSRMAELEGVYLDLLKRRGRA